MASRPSVAGLAACVAAGVGLWCSRAALDVFGGPTGETRVAMFPSSAEIAGLAALVVLVILLGRAGLGRAIGGRRWRRRGVVPPGDILLPLFAALLLGLPYLPWLPDWLPVVRALAGPLRVLLWTVLIGQILWSAWDALSAARGARGARRGVLVATVFLAGLAVVGGAAYRLAGGAIYPGGDEPHYLVMMHSLVQDHDLRIEDDHAELAPRPGMPAKPDFRARGVDGAIYSIHPVGLPILVAPAYAAGGYMAVVGCLVVIAALGGVLAWVAARELTGSGAAATTAWMGVFLSAPFVTLGFAVYPEICAALAVTLACLWRVSREDQPHWSWFVRGLAAASLPWLSTKYAPMSLAIVVVLVLRAWPARTAVALAAGPWAASCVAWLAFFRIVWGSFSPTAPYGASHETRLINAAIGAPALWLDQEYGVLIHAPALVLGFAGLVAMWRAGRQARRLAVETGLVLAALVLTVGAHYMWWGGSSPPGRQVVAGLLLLMPPLAWWARQVDGSPARRAALRVLVLTGLAVTGSLVLAHEGLLLANDRDGISDFLEWLTPTGEIATAFPSFIALRESPGTLLGALAAWTLLMLAGGAVVRRLPARHSGSAALLVLIVGATIAIAGVTAMPLVLPTPGSMPGLEARAEISMLDRYDARRRPIAIVYDPLRRVDPGIVPGLFALEGRPGLRRAPQPLRVLLNTRVALPAGSYEIEVRPRDGHAVEGEVGLQVGRVGPPLTAWRVARPAGEPWVQPFTLDVDASFVGLRTSPEFEDHVARLQIRPTRVVNAGDRPEVPAVLAAARFGDVAVYFHGDEVYPEAAGFWVRGHSTLAATFVLPSAHEGEQLRLRMHSGARPNRVRLDARLWATELALQPQVVRDVTVPVRSGQRVLPLEISTASGFVPADVAGGADRRRLGCWIEVLE